MGEENGCEYIISRERGLKCGLPTRGKPPYCIFHRPCEIKGLNNLSFYAEFLGFIQRETEKYRELSENEKERWYIDCRGFEFPDTVNYLRDLIIEAPINFGRAVFRGEANFEGTIFGENVVFNDVRFDDWSDFTGVEFNGFALFNGVNFGTEAKHDAMFRAAVFLKRAFYYSAIFTGDSDFRGTDFREGALFRDTEFRRRAFFKEAAFSGDCRFNRVVHIAEQRDNGGMRVIDKVIDDAAIVDFRAVTIAGNARMRIENSNHGEWAFVETPDLSRFYLINVSWHSEAKGKRCCTRDEEYLVQNRATYEAVADVYRILQEKYDKRPPYRYASDFHIRRMRLALRAGETTKWEKCLLWFSWITSKFGESLKIPILWLTGFWFLFGLVWLMYGFTAYETKVINWDWGLIDGGQSALREYLSDFKDSLIYTLKNFSTLPTFRENKLADLIKLFQYVVGVFFGVPLLESVIRKFHRAYHR